MLSTLEYVLSSPKTALVCQYSIFQDILVQFFCGNMYNVYCLQQPVCLLDSVGVFYQWNNSVCVCDCDCITVKWAWCYVFANLICMLLLLLLLLLLDLLYCCFSVLAIQTFNVCCWYKWFLLSRKFCTPAKLLHRILPVTSHAHYITTCVVTASKYLYQYVYHGMYFPSTPLTLMPSLLSEKDIVGWC